MNRKVELEWRYSPKNFLETDRNLDFNNTEIQFSEGKVTISTDEKTLLENPFFVTNAENTITNFLNGFSILHHLTFELIRESPKYFNKDGTISQPVIMKIESGTYVTTGGNIEFRITDKDGNVIRDSRQDRIKKEKVFASLISSVEGENQRIIDSYLNAINDKENELVHLYEIRDFVKTKLGGKYEALKMLPTSEDDWDLLGDIANGRPILEGRHRGQHEGKLRKATREELETSRNIAKEILFQYLKYDKSNS